MLTDVVRIYLKSTMSSVNNHNPVRSNTALPLQTPNPANPIVMLKRIAAADEDKGSICFLGQHPSEESIAIKCCAPDGTTNYSIHT